MLLPPLHKTLHLHMQFLSAHILRSASFSIKTAFAEWNRYPNESISKMKQCNFSIFRSGMTRNDFSLHRISSHEETRTNFLRSENRLGDLEFLGRGGWQCSVCWANIFLIFMKCSLVLSEFLYGYQLCVLFCFLRQLDLCKLLPYCEYGSNFPNNLVICLAYIFLHSPKV